MQKQCYAISTEHKIIVSFQNVKKYKKTNKKTQPQNQQNRTGAALPFAFSEKYLLKGTYLSNN